jgi:hypothetical protein
MKRLVIALALLGAVVGCLAGTAEAATRVSVQPIEGALGPDLRKQVARMLRGKGFRVLTSVDRVQGTGQYLTLARDHRLAAFVSADIEERKTRHTITFLIWNGANGSVLARWSASAAPKRLPKAVAKGFWKHLKQALQDAAAPARPQQMEEAPPMFVDAG